MTTIKIDNLWCAISKSRCILSSTSGDQFTGEQCELVAKKAAHVDENFRVAKRPLIDLVAETMREAYGEKISWKIINHDVLDRPLIILKLATVSRLKNL